MGQSLSLQAPFIIEILDRFGKVKQRNRIDKYPFTIGRAYTNDIIIDDPYISPVHLKIDSNVNYIFTVADNDSENGLFSTAPLKQHDNLIINNNLRIRIGHTDIRFRSLEYSVRETAIQRSTPSKLSMLATNFYTFLFVWLFSAGIFIVDDYMAETGEVSFKTLLSGIIAMFFLFAAWAALWSIASKVITHRFYFTYHAVLICSLLITLTVIEIFSENIEFAFSLVDFTWWTLALTTAVFSIALIYGHLNFSSPLSKKKMLIAAIISAGSLNFVVHLAYYLDKPEYSTQLVYSKSIKVPDFIMANIRSSNDFFASAVDLKEQVDELVVKK
ncbi:MAG: FHA domain-containing protein [Gammaproteobacteria bacterium]